MPRVSWNDVARYPIALPPDEVLERFDTLIRIFVDRIKVNVFESRTLNELRNLLLPKLLSGEIRVSEAERVVEAAV